MNLRSKFPVFAPLYFSSSPLYSLKRLATLLLFQRQLCFVQDSVSRWSIETVTGLLLMVSLSRLIWSLTELPLSDFFLRGVKNWNVRLIGFSWSFSDYERCTLTTRWRPSVIGTFLPLGTKKNNTAAKELFKVPPIIGGDLFEITRGEIAKVVSMILWQWVTLPLLDKMVLDTICGKSEFIIQGCFGKKSVAKTLSVTYIFASHHCCLCSWYARLVSETDDCRLTLSGL